MPGTNPSGYFISFHTFASWLHGDERGSVDPHHHIFGSSFLPPDPIRRNDELEKLGGESIKLDLARRHVVQGTIQEVCNHRGWVLLALHVRTTHVHGVISSSAHAPERIMNDWKSWCTRRLVEGQLLPEKTKAWSRHGSTRYLWNEVSVAGAVDYVLNRQGPLLTGGPTPYWAAQMAFPNGRGSDSSAIE